MKSLTCKAAAHSDKRLRQVAVPSWSLTYESRIVPPPSEMETSAAIAEFGENLRCATRWSSAPSGIRRSMPTRSSLLVQVGFAPDRPLSADVYAAYLSLAKSGMRCNPRS